MQTSLPIMCRSIFIIIVNCCVWLRVACWSWLLHRVYIMALILTLPQIIFSTTLLTIDCCCAKPDITSYYSMSLLDFRVQSLNWLLCLMSAVCCIAVSLLPYTRIFYVSHRNLLIVVYAVQTHQRHHPACHTWFETISLRGIVRFAWVVGERKVQ